MMIVHLTASTFFGGPERQMLGLAASLPEGDRSVFLLFSEEGRCRAFLDRCQLEGFEARELTWDTPHFLSAVRELTGTLRQLGADVLCCHGYKANLLGRLAARGAGIPVVAVSRGWTGESRRVRLYEALDRLNMRWMDHIVCVSQAQAAKVRKAGVPARKIGVIPNAIHAGRFENPDPTRRAEQERLFDSPVRRIIGAAGRLSPEKGFNVLVDAASLVLKSNTQAGFVLYGDGTLHDSLATQIAAQGLEGRFVLAGFRSDLDLLIPHLDLLVIPSFTEGLPNVALEACAAGVPVVATEVGGNPEVIVDRWNGYLVPPGDPEALALRIVDALESEEHRREMGQRGRARVTEHFTFGAQARAYSRLFNELRHPDETDPAKIPAQAALDLAAAAEER